MGMRELLILVLLLAIIGVVLRGLYLAIYSRRNQLKVNLQKNVPEYDLEELELRELPNGGARMVERSFAQVRSDNSAREKRESVSRGRSAAKPSNKQKPGVIPVLVDVADRRAEVSEEVPEGTPEEMPEESAEDLAEEISDEDYYRQPGEQVEDIFSGEPEPEPENEAEAVDETQSSDDFDGDALDDVLSNARFRTRGAVAREPEPTPEQEPEPEDYPEEDADIFAADFDDDDFDQEDRERRLQEIAEREAAQRDSVTSRVMNWAGRTFGSTGRKDADPASNPGFESESDSALETQSEKKESMADLFDSYETDHDHDPVSKHELDDPEEEAPEPVRVAPAADEPTAKHEQEQAASERLPDYSEVVVLNIMARPHREISGDDLLSALLAAGLRFGDMNIFHYHANHKHGPVVFSVANILNPGTFDLNHISDFSSKGLCFFMTMPSVVDNMQAFEKMLQAARQVQQALDAELKDDNRSVMTAQTIEHYRQRIRDFELQQLRDK